MLVLALLALIAVQAEEEVVVQEVKPSGDETVGGHDKKVKKIQNMTTGGENTTNTLHSCF